MDKLEPNLYEDAFATLMMILMCNENEIFDHITCEQMYFDFRGHKFDLRPLTKAWKIWCTQNVRKIGPQG